MEKEKWFCDQYNFVVLLKSLLLVYVRAHMFLEAVPACSNELEEKFQI
nr:hypothetical protein [Tanacetum cinerariifolium]